MGLIGSAVNARLENTSVIYITGSVPTNYFGTKCFQDTSVVGSNDEAVFKAAINHSVRCENGEDVGSCLSWIDQSIEQNFPIHIVIPMDIQREEVSENIGRLSQDLENGMFKHTRQDDQEKVTLDDIPLKTVMTIIRRVSPENTICCLDSGQVRYAGNKYLKPNHHLNIFQAEKQAPMGWALCASVGMKLAAPENTVIAIFGDGTMRMHGIELATAVKYQLPIIFILCDNQRYGTVYKRNQNTKYETLSSLNYIDWEQYAEALGVHTFHINEMQKLEPCFKEALELQKTCLVWIHIPQADDILNEITSTDWRKDL